MGVTLSRPLQSLEGHLLGAAAALDHLLRRAERGVASLLHAAFGPLFGFERPSTIARVCDDDGVCYIPATHAARRRRKLEQSRVARRAARAERAAREVRRARDAVERGARDAMRRAGERADEEKERLVHAVDGEKARVAHVIDAEKAALLRRVSSSGTTQAGARRAPQELEAQTRDIVKQAERRKSAALAAVDDSAQAALAEIQSRKREAVHVAAVAKERLVVAATRQADPSGTQSAALSAAQNDTADLLVRLDAGAHNLASGAYAGLASAALVAQQGATQALAYVSQPSPPAKPAAVSLGEPAKAPAPRPEHERMTATEKAKGTLWVMGNAVPSAAASAQPELVPRKSSKKAAQYEAAKAQAARSDAASAAAVDNAAVSERYTPASARTADEEVHVTPTKDVGAMRGRGRRLDIVAEGSTSGSPSGKPAQHFEPEPLLKGHGRRTSGSEHGNLTYLVMAKSPSSEGQNGPLPRSSASAEQSDPARVRKVSKTRAAEAQAAREEQSNVKALISPPADAISPISGAAKRFKHGHSSSLPVNVLSSEPGLLSGALRRANKARRTETPTPVAVSADFSPPPIPPPTGSASARMFSAARASFDSVRGAAAASALSGESAANSETGSVAGASSCGKPPLGVADMAERACMSRLDTSRKERRVWRDEVNRVALQRCQANQARAQRSTPTSPSSAGAARDVNAALSNGPADLVRRSSARSSTSLASPKLGKGKARRVSAAAF